MKKYTKKVKTKLTKKKAISLTARQGDCKNSQHLFIKIYLFTFFYKNNQKHL